MKNGTIVPDVNERDMPLAGHVRLDPRDASGSLQGGGGNVEHTDAADAFAEDEVHEAGIPAPMSMIQVAGPRPTDSRRCADMVGTD